MTADATPAGLRVAVLGCGRVARLFHLPIASRLPGASLVLVAEADPAGRAAAAALAPGARAIDDWRAAVDDPGVDAVVVTLPSGLHAEVAVAAFAGGKHVYLEKPIATDRADGESVVAAWRASGRVGMTGFHARHDPLVRALRDRVRSGEAGTVAGARIAIGAAARDLPAWKRARGSGGGVLLDLGSHAVDLARFLFGREVEGATAAVSSVRTEGDTAALALTLDGGTIVHAFVSLAGVQESRIEVVGDRGALVLDRYARTLALRPPSPPYGRPAQARRALSGLAAAARRGAGNALSPPDDALAYRAALGAFVDAARRGGPAPEPDLEDGLRSLAVVLTAEAAAGAA